MTVNDFLTCLDNRNTTFDGIYRGPDAALKQYTGLRSRVWGALFGNTNKAEHFRIACEIMLILRNSVVAPWEVMNDPRITYTDDDLALALAGKGSTITGNAHPLEYIVTPDSTSKQTWTVQYLGGGTIQSTDADGRVKTVSGLVFPANTWVQFDLASLQGKAQVLEEPPTNAVWTISRDENYNSQMNTIAERLDELSADEVTKLLPADLVGLYRVTPVLKGPLRVAAAAAGVVYGP